MPLTDYTIAHDEFELDQTIELQDGWPCDLCASRAGKRANQPPCDRCGHSEIARVRATYFPAASAVGGAE